MFRWRPEEVWAVHGNWIRLPVWLVTAHVCSLLVHGEGQEISGPYLHSYSGFPVPQLWSRRNDKHYRGAEVTEGAEPRITVIFSQMEPLVPVGPCRVRAAAPEEASDAASVRIPRCCCSECPDQYSQLPEAVSWRFPLFPMENLCKKCSKCYANVHEMSWKPPGPRPTRGPTTCGTLLIICSHLYVKAASPRATPERAPSLHRNKPTLQKHKGNI